MTVEDLASWGDVTSGWRERVFREFSKKSLGGRMSSNIYKGRLVVNEAILILPRNHQKNPSTGILRDA
ncbi:hypothetical protein [Streptomyces spinosirectus]